MIFPSFLNIPQKTVFEKDSVYRLEDYMRCYGDRGLIVHGKSSLKNGVIEKLANDNIHSYLYKNKEPNLHDIEDLISFIKSNNIDWVAGLGGGSVLDLSKAGAGLCNASSDLALYQKGQIVENVGLPFAAIPTTAGTGSEVTKNSVIINKSTCEKLSIRDDNFVAKLVILDSSLLENLPSTVIASAGMDALTQAIESYISINSSWYSEHFAYKSFSLLVDNLELFYQNNEDPMRSKTLLASYFAGCAFSISRLGVIHGIAHPLGVIYDIPHGELCGFLLPFAVKLNYPAIKQKYERMSSYCGCDLLDFINKLNERMGISNPFVGKDLEQKEKIITETLASGSTKANPLKIEQKHVEDLLENIFRN